MANPERPVTITTMTDEALVNAAMGQCLVSERLGDWTLQGLWPYVDQGQTLCLVYVENDALTAVIIPSSMGPGHTAFENHKYKQGASAYVCGRDTYELAMSAALRLA